MKNKVIEHLSQVGIIPVVKIEALEQAIPLVKAMKNGGIDCAEITYRSEHASAAIKHISENLPEVMVGAGTILNVEQAKEAVAVGAKFIITPGFNRLVVEWCIANEILIIPGVSTASEIEQALEYGLKYLKFFPAESSGGAQKLKDLSAPYQNIKFIPTGGINTKNFHDYLSLDCVEAIGGSFMIDQKAINEGDYSLIETLSKQAISSMLAYELIHLGIDANTQEEAESITKLLCHLFNFKYYEKPKSYFAGKQFEVRFTPSDYLKGHFGIYTPYPERAMYQLAKLGITFDEKTITRNKKTQKINFVYLNLDIAGFGVHLINPDLKM